MKFALVASIVLSVLAGASMRVRAGDDCPSDGGHPARRDQTSLGAHRHELCRCPSDASIGLPICQPQLIPGCCS